MDLFITYEDYTQSRVSVKYNQEIAGQYLEYLHQIGRNFIWTAKSVQQSFLVIQANSHGRTDQGREGALEFSEETIAGLPCSL